LQEFYYRITHYQAKGKKKKVQKHKHFLFAYAGQKSSEPFEWVAAYGRRRGAKRIFVKTSA